MLYSEIYPIKDLKEKIKQNFAGSLWLILVTDLLAV